MQVTKADILAAQRELERRKQRDDFPYFALEHLKVRSKSGQIVPFRINQAQEYVHQRLEAQKARTGKVRALILKGRQAGFSTYIGGRFYHQTTFRKGVQCFILTHEQEATNNLFGMVDRYHANNESQFKPSTGASNAKELYFDQLDSGYSVGTAGSKAVGRSKTVQLFHGSEVAFWPNASSHFAGVVQAIPDLPGTEIILESTANGVGGEFHTRWQRAEAGDGDFEAIFIPWFWSEEYRRPVPEGFSLTTEEETYLAAHKLDLEQMVWRRAKIIELNDPVLFKQEYPATASEAFQSVGHDSFIPNEAVLKARKTTKEPLGQLIVGVDPARFGDDATAVAWRRGGVVEKVERRYKMDSVAKANWVKAIIDNDKPAKVFIDAGGGYGDFIDILRDWGGEYRRLCEAVNFGSEPQDPPKISDDGELIPGPKNRRAEMWKRSKEWLEEGADIPDDDALHADACGPGYHYDLKQYLLLESKKDMRARGARSPDAWDAVALTFASPVASVIKVRDPYETSRRRASAWAS